MKRKRLSFLFGGSSTLAFAVAGVPVPGCESTVFDPQAFLAENMCNIFNCDTLFFLPSEHDDMEMEAMDEAEGDEHQH